MSNSGTIKIEKTDTATGQKSSDGVSDTKKLFNGTTPMLLPICMTPNEALSILMETDKAYSTTLLDQIDGSGSDAERAAVNEIRTMFGVDFPVHMMRIYKNATKFGVRAACVFYCFPNAQRSSLAQELGLLSLDDRSKIVRYRGCQLLAYSQELSLLPRLKNMIDRINPSSIENLKAAIDAIESQNQNYFVDRKHTGKIMMSLAGEDDSAHGASSLTTH